MQFDLTYDYLTRHVVPGPHWPSFIAALFLLPIALLIPRQTLSRTLNISLFVPLVVGLIVHSCYKTQGLDVIAVDVLLWALFLLVFTDPQADFCRLDPSKLSTDYRHFRRKQKIGEDSPAKASATGVETPPTSSVLKSPNGSMSLPASPRRPAGPRKSVSFRAAEEPYPYERFTSRLHWVGSLLISIRLTNWKIGLDSHDRVQPVEHPTPLRSVFFVQALTNVIRGYIILDVTRAYISYDPYFHDLSVSITSPLPLPPLSTDFSGDYRLFAFKPWMNSLVVLCLTVVSYIPPHVFRTAATAAQAWALVAQLFYLPFLLPLTLNMLGLIPDSLSPHTWPPYFGSIRTVFTHGLRGFWGKYWHQTMRYAVGGPGYALCEILGLRSGTKSNPRPRADDKSTARKASSLRYWLLTVCAFFCSGIVHMGLVPPEPLHATISTNAIRLLVAGFFWVQPLGILIEMGLETLWSLKDDGRGMRKRNGVPFVVNGIWSFLWFSFSVMFLSEAGRQLGYWRVWPVPVSLWTGLRGGGWVAWPCLLA